MADDLKAAVDDLFAFLEDKAQTAPPKRAALKRILEEDQEPPDWITITYPGPSK